MNYWDLSPKNIFVAAHRGWSAAYPENTMEAFRAALTQGVDQIETDVRMSADGELVLIHDPGVGRTTYGTGEVCEMTFAQLQELDAGKPLGLKGQGHKIPRLVDLFELVKDEEKLTLDLELKVYPTEGNEQVAYDICDRVLAMVDEYGFTDRCVINSFSAKLNEYIFTKYGKKYRQHVYYPKTYLGECTIDPYSYAYCCCMFMEKDEKAKAEFDAMAARGVQPWAGASVKDAETVDWAIQSGAYLITANNVDEVLRLLRERGYHA